MARRFQMEAASGMRYARTGMNGRRADWAKNAIDAFIDATHMGGEDDDTIIGDLLVDLMHYCHQNRIAFDPIIDRSTQCFIEEFDGRGD